MKILNFVVQNMVNNVDYFFPDCYSKAFGNFLQKSDQPILLLYKSQKLFYHALGKQFIMNKNSLQLILLLCFIGDIPIQRLVFEALILVILSSQTFIKETVWCYSYVFNIVRMHWKFKACVSWRGYACLEVKERNWGWCLSRTKFGCLMADDLQFVFWNLDKFLSFLPVEVHTKNNF